MLVVLLQQVVATVVAVAVPEELDKMLARQQVKVVMVVQAIQLVLPVLQSSLAAVAEAELIIVIV